MLKSAIELAKITSEDPFSGIPEPSQLGALSGDLDLFSTDVYSLPGEERIAYARRAEKAALDFDTRIMVKEEAPVQFRRVTKLMGWQDPEPKAKAARR